MTNGFKRPGPSRSRACRWCSAWAVAALLVNSAWVTAQEDTDPDDGNALPVIDIPASPTPSEPTTSPPPAPPLDLDRLTDPLPSFPVQPLPADAVLTPTRTVQPLSSVGSSVSVITREQIRASQQISAVELLRAQLGIDVARSGPAGQTGVFMRGANSGQTKVLLDGMPLNNPANPNRAFDFGQLTVDNIERIEILRGPQSTLYGSDAIGGVINIITARGEGPPRATLRSSYGAFQTSVQEASVSGGGPDTWYSVGASYQDSAGFSALNTNIDRDGYHIGNVSARAGALLTENVSLDVTVLHNNSNIDIDPFGIDGPGVNFIDRTHARARLGTTFFDDLWESAINLDGASNLLRDERGPFGDSFFNGQQYRLDWQNNLQLAEGHLFSFGLDASEEYGHSTFLARTRLTNLGFWIQDQIAIGERLFLTAGARWDDYSQAGPAETYRATARFNINETGTSVRGSIGTGFRAPSLVELEPVFGNPNLRPEESRGWDYGVEQAFLDGDLILGATYFRNDFRNLIIANFPTFIPENVGRARTHGVEISAITRLDERSTLAIFYTHLDTRDQIEDIPLVRRARDNVRVSVGRSYWDDRANAALTVMHVGNREDVGRVPLAPYWRFDLAGSVRLTNSAGLFARIDNLFGAKYEEIADFNVPGATFYGGVQVGGW